MFVFLTALGPGTLTKVGLPCLFPKGEGRGGRGEISFVVSALIYDR